MIHSKEYVDFLVKHSITQREFLFLYLSLNREYDLMDKFKKAFPVYALNKDEESKFLNRHEFQSLVDKNLIEKIDTGEYVITDTFINLFGKKEFLIHDIFNKYPKFMYNDTKTKRFALTVCNLAEVADVYHKAIYGSLSEHRQIIKDLQYATENGLINLKFENFIRSQYWLTIRAVQEEQQQNYEENTVKVNVISNLDADE